MMSFLTQDVSQRKTEFCQDEAEDYTVPYPEESNDTQSVASAQQ